MRKIIKNKGIVIKVQDYLENAVLATILTAKGKETLIIRGAKKVNSSTKRFAGVLTKLEFNHTETKGISTLTEALVLDNYTSIKDDLIKFNYAIVILEKLNFFSEQITDYETLYNFTSSILDVLKNTNYNNAVNLIFEIKLLYLLGVAPSFNKCPSCGGKALNGALDIRSGGFLCEKCHYLKEVSLNINDSLLFKKIYITKINEINEDYLKEFNDHVNINKCINKYYEWHLDFKSRVKEILEKIG